MCRHRWRLVSAEVFIQAICSPGIQPSVSRQYCPEARLIHITDNVDFDYCRVTSEIQVNALYSHAWKPHSYPSGRLCVVIDEEDASIGRHGRRPSRWQRLLGFSNCATRRHRLFLFRLKTKFTSLQRSRKMNTYVHTHTHTHTQTHTHTFNRQFFRDYPGEPER